MESIASQPVTNGNINRDQGNSTNLNDTHVRPGTFNQEKRNSSKFQRRRNKGRHDERNKNGEQSDLRWERRPSRNRDEQPSEDLTIEGKTAGRNQASRIGYGSNKGNQFKPFRSNGKENSGHKPWPRKNNQRRDESQVESGPVCSRNSGRTDNTQSVDIPESPRNNGRVHYSQRPVNGRKKHSRNNGRARKNYIPAYDDPQLRSRLEESRNNSLAHDDSQQVPHGASRNNDVVDNDELPISRYETVNNSDTDDLADDEPQQMNRPESSKNYIPVYNDQQPMSRSKTANNSGAVGLEIIQGELNVFQFTNEPLKCSICFDEVLENQTIWICKKCHHILHLTCAALSSGNFNWRCPACRHTSPIVPGRSYCFCGKTEYSTWCQSYRPHSCDEYCGKVIKKPFCGHHCVRPCHPGPCPPCQRFANYECDLCGTERIGYCNSTKPMLCRGTCTKLRSCGTHRCLRLCHEGSCPPCENTCDKVRSCGTHRCQQPCHTGACPPCDMICGRRNCGRHRCLQFCHVGCCPPCENTCDKVRSCGTHRCLQLCHVGSCPPCENTCDKVRSCGTHRCQQPCHTGACPPCDMICGRRNCGRHSCQQRCHPGNCPPCRVPCAKISFCGEHRCLKTCHDYACPPCEDICTKFRNCGYHRCGQHCHTASCPPCILRCVKLKACGKHRCHQFCHSGTCQPCTEPIMLQACMCGNNWQPYPCGTKPSDVATFKIWCMQCNYICIVGLFGLWALKKFLSS